MEQFKPSSEEKPSENSLTMRLGKRIEAKFDGGLISSDGGKLLVRKADRELELTEMAVLCLTDWRQGSAVKHSLQALFLQQLDLALCTGAEDCNDAACCVFRSMQ
ncbi:MAG: transposase [Candidatus Obscuribacterales bacterium]